MNFLLARTRIPVFASSSLVIKNPTVQQMKNSSTSQPAQYIKLSPELFWQVIAAFFELRTCFGIARSPWYRHKFFQPPNRSNTFFFNFLQHTCVNGRKSIQQKTFSTTCLRNPSNLKPFENIYSLNQRNDKPFKLSKTIPTTTPTDSLPMFKHLNRKKKEIHSKSSLCNIKTTLINKKLDNTSVKIK